MVFYHMMLSHDFQKSCDKFVTGFYHMILSHDLTSALQSSVEGTAVKKQFSIRKIKLINQTVWQIRWIMWHKCHMVFCHMILSHDFQKSCDKFITWFYPAISTTGNVPGRDAARIRQFLEQLFASRSAAGMAMSVVNCWSLFLCPVIP